MTHAVRYVGGPFDGDSALKSGRRGWIPPSRVERRAKPNGDVHVYERVLILPDGEWTYAYRGVVE